jgi:hypothetical protein
LSPGSAWSVPGITYENEFTSSPRTKQEWAGLGYLGRGDSFDHAVAIFASSYADQTERDHAAMVQAVQAGHLVAETETQH